jgi:hypothetical protein
MLRYSRGKIRLADHIIDLSTYTLRRKVTDADLETNYTHFIKDAAGIADCFKDRDAFEVALGEAAGPKKPRLIARELRYPFFLDLRESFRPTAFLQPEKRRLQDKYFIAPHCIVNIQRGEHRTADGSSLESALRQDILEKFKQHPCYEGIIEIPDDATPAATKMMTYHESLHYLIFRYQAGTGRRFVDVLTSGDLSALQVYRAEHVLHEAAVEGLTDRMLNTDPDAQLEGRWLQFSALNGFLDTANLASALGTAIIAGCSFHNPMLVPAIPIPHLLLANLRERYKQSKRKELLQPREWQLPEI